MLILLSGVSGAGKDTIKRELIKRSENIVSLPSYTDRKPREGEKNGEQYNFVSTEEFKKLIEQDDLYEYDVHHNHYYGTSKKLLNERLKSGKIIVKDIDVNGVENLVRLLGKDVKIVTIFLKVGKDELRRRLINRNPHADQNEIELRLSRLDYEESKMEMYNYIIENYDLEKTIQTIQKIIQEEKTIK